MLNCKEQYVVDLLVSYWNVIDGGIGRFMDFSICHHRRHHENVGIFDQLLNLATCLPKLDR